MSNQTFTDWRPALAEARKGNGNKESFLNRIAVEATLQSREYMAVPGSAKVIYFNVSKSSFQWELTPGELAIINGTL